MSGALNSTFLNNLANPPAANPQYWGQQMSNMNALQDYNAKQATADAYRQSIDPTTGQVDQAKFNLLLSHGAGAWNAGPAMQQQGQAQGAQAVGSADQVAGRLAQLKVMNGEMTDLLQSGQPITADMIHARLNSLGQEGILTPAAMNGINADLNSQPPGADLTGWLRNHYATGLSASDALKNVTSQPQTVDQGDRKIVVEGNPNMPGGQRVGTSYQQGQAPPPLGTTVQIHYPDGTTKQVTPDQVQSELGGHPGSRVVPPGSVSSSEAPVNAAGDSATRKAAEGGPPAAGTPGAAVAQRTHDFWISQGYNEAQVAGILAGGPGSESDFNPSVSGDKGTSYGLYQHHAERLAAMQKYFGLSGNQMPSEAQQNQYAAYEISPQGPLAAVGAQLKQATTPAQAAAVWTRGFGVPGDKTEIGRRANGAGRYAGIYAQSGAPEAATPSPAPTTASALPLPPTPVPPPPGSPFGATAFSQPSTALPAPASQATAPNTTAAVPPVPTPQMAAATAVARKTGRPAPIAGTDGLFANPDGSVGSGRNAGGLSRRADVGNALLQGVQTAQTTMPPASALTAGPGAPTTGLPAGATPTVPPANAFGTGAFGSATAAPPAPAPTAPTVVPQPAVQPPAQAVPPQAARGAGWSAPPGYVEAQQTAAKGAAARGNDLVTQLTASSTVKPILAEMEDVLTKSGGTGFGTAHISAFRQALERLGLTPAAIDVATPQAALETFKKLSAQLQGAQLGTVGGVPTDDRQSLIESSNPSVLNSTVGNKSIIHVLQGTQQALETMGRAWMASPDYKNNPGNFDKWRTDFTAKDPATGGQFDPRTFWLNNMPPDEQHAYLSNMTPKGMAEFKKNWAFARKQGWVDPLPGQPATAPAPGG